MSAFSRLLAMAVSLAGLTPAAMAAVTIEAPWIRGVVAGQSATGAFMTIRSDEAVELVAVASPSAADVSVHRTAMVDGMMTMAPVAALPIPAHGSVQLAPGGYHVMLTGLRMFLPMGTLVPLTLTFRDAARHETSVTVQAQVRDVTGVAAMGSR